MCYVKIVYHLCGCETDEGFCFFAGSARARCRLRELHDVYRPRWCLECQYADDDGIPYGDMDEDEDEDGVYNDWASGIVEYDIAEWNVPLPPVKIHRE
jgi:hypothetical protein